MNVLLTGATGFIGRHVARALELAGHSVIAAQRQPGGAYRYVPADFTRDHEPAVWLPRLNDVDAVINTVGIIRESGAQRFADLHTRAPGALFDACVVAGVSRVVQISALGAASGTTGYFTSKRAADEHLMTLPLQWTIVYPSIVYGDDGTSARLFALLASLPLTPLPGRGQQRLQPVHINDLTAALVAVLADPLSFKQRIPIVGPASMSLREYVSSLRQAMNLGPSRFLSVPMPFMRMAAWSMSRLRVGLLDLETLSMLEAGNVGDPQQLQQLLGRAPRSVDTFISADHADVMARTALLGWLLPVLRVSLALVWLWSGITSFGLYPREESYRMLTAAAVPSPLQPLLLFGAATLDIGLGLATLLWPRRLLWLGQIALILLYTAVISVALSSLWLHPFGPVLKNLPMLALLLLLYYLEPRDARR